MPTEETVHIATEVERMTEFLAFATKIGIEKVESKAEAEAIHNKLLETRASLKNHIASLLLISPDEVIAEMASYGYFI